MSHGVEQGQFLNRLVQTQLYRPLARVSLIMAFGGGIAAPEMLTSSVAPAGAQATTTETTPDGSGCQVDQTKARSGQPYDSCYDMSWINNGDVMDCQSMEVGMDKNSTYNMIAWRRLKGHQGTKRIQINEGLRRQQGWEGNAFLYACAALTKNYVEERLVERTGKGKHHHIKPLGKTVIVHGDDSIKFDGHITKVVPTHETLPLPRKLTKKDRKSHRFGVRDVIISEPLLENRPTWDAPQHTRTQRSKPHTTWIK